MIRLIGGIVGILLVLGTIYIVGKWIYRLIKKLLEKKDWLLWIGFIVLENTGMLLVGVMMTNHIM